MPEATKRGPSAMLRHGSRQLARGNFTATAVVAATLAAAAVLYCEVYAFNAAVLSCAWPDGPTAVDPPTHQQPALKGQGGANADSDTASATSVSSTPGGDGADLRLVVVSDVHMLGEHFRNAVDIAWTDWQLRKTFSALARWRQPDVFVNLGDFLDEGYRATTGQFQRYSDRYTSVAAVAADTALRGSINVVGNHDTEFGYAASEGAVARFESSFGPTHFVRSVGNVTFVGVNAMVLDGPQMEPALQERAKRFVNDFAGRRGAVSGPVVLLTHMPLYRANDLDCGPDRLAEKGHVTYEAPQHALKPHKEVLSRDASLSLLKAVRPTVVISGHLHARCQTTHRVRLTPRDAPADAEPTTVVVPEVTVPTLSWRMRPDPSFALLTIPRRVMADASGSPPVMPGVAVCTLPHEQRIFTVYKGLGVAEATLWLWFAAAQVLASRSDPRHDDVKRQ